MKPFKMKQVISGIKYDTEKAVIIADDCYWDGHNWERNGRNTFLYKTQMLYAAPDIEITEEEWA